MRQLRPFVALVSQIVLAVGFASPGWGAQQVPVGAPAPTSASADVTPSQYVLGPGDVITIRALHAEEVGGTSIRIEPNGEVSLPLLGRLSVAGLTIEGVERQLVDRLKVYVHDPDVAVTVVEYRSQPVSVIGAVGQPGVHQLEGRKTLIEVIAKAGGLRDEAANVVKITRRAEWGKVPLSSAVMEPTGQFSVAEVDLNGIIQATNPDDNLLILPNDVISVPRANMVYVIGDVVRPGGFILNERKTISGLHALAMAQGFTATAAPDKAMVVRELQNGERVEIQANLKQILSGKKSDVELLPNDVLFVPTNVAKNVLRQTLTTAISALTSVAIYRIY
jgi:polysaccharide biosynthesis/export protein